MAACTALTVYLQKFLTTCDSWTLDYGLIWSVGNCASIRDNFPVVRLEMSGGTLKDKTETRYLGASLRFGSLSDKLSFRLIDAAMKCITFLSKSFGDRELTINQRASLIKTFVVPKYEYDIHLIETTERFKRKVENLVLRATSWIPGTGENKLMTKARSAIRMDCSKTRR